MILTLLTVALIALLMLWGEERKHGRDTQAMKDRAQVNNVRVPKRTTRAARIKQYCECHTCKSEKEMGAK